jgi:tetratricopeptide (TPR) repeat protein
MIAGLHSERGDIEQAAIALREALVAARTEDERSEAHYELGVLYEKAGDIEAAIASLREVAAGFRDRDERLEQLTT